MLKLRVGYPTRDEEKEIMRRMSGGAAIDVSPVAGPTQILDARRRIAELYVDERIVDYIVDIVHATRAPREAGLADLAPLIEFGASPRATIALAQASRAHAFLRGRTYVTPDDVKSIAPDVLRHRVLTSFEADARRSRATTSWRACSRASRAPERARGARGLTVPSLLDRLRGRRAPAPPPPPR
jgi:MoxR-like ATPase